jgi:hypothetical protein
MNDNIKEIQQELKELFQKRLVLAEAQQQRVKTCEQQKTLYQQLFGQPPLPSDPKLEAINSEIAHLQRRELEYIKVLQAAASVPPPVPETDWTKSPFYSHTLKSWNYDYPVDQMGFYLTSVTGIGLVSKALWRSWNIKKAGEILEKGVESDMLPFHRHFSGLNNEQLKDARMMRQAVTLKAFAYAGLMISGFSAYVQLKNRDRFKE